MVDAPFPLSPEEVEQHIEYMRGPAGWELPQQERGATDPSYQLLANSLNTLQGRMRQGVYEGEFGFEPQPTPGQNRRGRGVSAFTHAPRMSMYANTPVTIKPRTTQQAVGRVGVRGATV